ESENIVLRHPARNPRPSELRDIDVVFLRNFADKWRRPLPDDALRVIGMGLTARRRTFAASGFLSAGAFARAVSRVRGGTGSWYRGGRGLCWRSVCLRRRR